MNGIKIYNFSYGGFVKKIISKLITLFYNCIISTIMIFIYADVITSINLELHNDFSKTVYDIIIGVELLFGLLVFLFFVLLSFRKQRVVVCNDIIKIRRHYLFFNLLLVFRGFNDTIPIESIKDIYIARNKQIFKEPIPVNIVDWKNLVVIETDSKWYYAPVENSSEFIDEINRIKKHLQN